MQTVPSPCPGYSDGFAPQKSAQNAPFNVASPGCLHLAREKRALKLAGWAKLHLRQNFADASWLRGQIRAAGLRAPNHLEPASVPRLRNLLKRASVTGLETREAIGTTLACYLKLNPLLPLWAALALVLEATGRFMRTGEIAQGAAT